METVHLVDVPEHAPDHPVNFPPLGADAVSVTDVPETNANAQVLPQLIPVGLDVTVPSFVPVLLTERVKIGWNVAVSERAWLIVTEQVDVPVHDPDQPVKRDPGVADAVSTTLMPDA
jgi:hypothetical protein